MKRGCPALTAMWFTANHGVIRNGAPKRGRAEYCVGLDAHGKQAAFVIQDASGRVVAQRHIPTDRERLRPLQASHRLVAATLLAPETGTIAFVTGRAI